MNDLKSGYSHPLYFTVGMQVYVRETATSARRAIVVEARGDSALVELQPRQAERLVFLNDCAVPDDVRTAQLRASALAGARM